MPVPTVGGVAALPAIEAKTAAGFAQAEKAASTRRAYGTDFKLFTAVPRTGRNGTPGQPTVQIECTFNDM